MIYNLQCFMLICVIIQILSSLSFAPWIDRPEPPTDGRTLTCQGWLHYHGFVGHPDNPNELNRGIAESRRKMYDKDASLWAAGFAYMVTNSSNLYTLHRFGPSEFCFMHVLDEVHYRYMRLKDAEFTCEGWIDFYIYNPRRDYNNVRAFYMTTDVSEFNMLWAQHRDRSMDDKISIWAVGFFKFITSDRSVLATTPAEYCKMMGQQTANIPLPRRRPFMTIDGTSMSCIEWNEQRSNVQLRENIRLEQTPVKKLSFMSIAGTTMTCQKWIELYGFPDEESSFNPVVVAHCFLKIFTEMKDFDNISSWAKYYTVYFEEWYEGDQTEPLKTPRQFCDYINRPDTTDIGFLDNGY